MKARICQAAAGRLTQRRTLGQALATFDYGIGFQARLKSCTCSWTASLSFSTTVTKASPTIFPTTLTTAPRVQESVALPPLQGNFVRSSEKLLQHPRQCRIFHSYPHRWPLDAKTVSNALAPSVFPAACLTAPRLFAPGRRGFKVSAINSDSAVTAISLTSKKRRGQKITMVTAYDYPSAVHVARAGMDIILVGDSVAMVELGYDTTQPITVDTMLHHCQTVKRGVAFASVPVHPLLVGDMPFGSYEFDNTDIALQNAYRFVKEAGMDAVKLEGGGVARARTARKLVQGGVAVMGHVGLTPQAISVIGGFRAQGRTAIRARALLDDALRLQDAGCFAIVLECVPANVAAAITETLEIPTIGIGAGGQTSGQVLVFHDMLGMLSHPHHEQFVPKFCKRYAQVGHMIQDGLQEFKKDVECGEFPGQEFSPYKMAPEERVLFDKLLAHDADERQRKHEQAAEKYEQTDEYVKLQLYGNNTGGVGSAKRQPEGTGTTTMVLDKLESDDYKRKAQEYERILEQLHRNHKKNPDDNTNK